MHVMFERNEMRAGGPAKTGTGAVTTGAGDGDSGAEADGDATDEPDGADTEGGPDASGGTDADGAGSGWARRTSTATYTTPTSAPTTASTTSTARMGTLGPDADTLPAGPAPSSKRSREAGALAGAASAVVSLPRSRAITARTASCISRAPGKRSRFSNASARSTIAATDAGTGATSASFGAGRVAA